MPSSSAKEAEFGWPGGDQPGELDFAHPVPAEMAAALLKVLDPAESAGEVRALNPVAESPVGRFAWSGPNGCKFVRVSAKSGEPALEQALVAFLESHGVAVNPLDQAGLPLVWRGARLRVDVRPLLRGGHFDGSLAQLQALATELARCHEALRRFPQAGLVRGNAARRFVELGAVVERMRSALAARDWNYFGPHPQWAEREAGWLAQMAASFRPRFDEEPGAQCLHAQVHRGNVVFREGDQRPVLLDFEEAVYTYAPIAWDLAYFVQRFALHDNPAPAARAGRLEAIRAGYGQPLSGVADMMRQTAWLSVAILARDWNERRVQAPLAEHEKFVRLEKQARELETIL